MSLVLNREESLLHLAHSLPTGHLPFHLSFPRVVFATVMVGVRKNTIETIMYPNTATTGSMNPKISVPMMI